VKDLLDVTRQAAALALSKGASAAAAGTYRARHVEVAWRDGKLEKVSEATTRGLGLDLYVDGRYAAVSTSDLRPEALDRFVEDAVALARTLAPDPYRLLPDPELYRGQARVDLELEDPAYGAVEAAERRRVAEELEAAARAVPGAGKILSVTASVSDTRAESALVQTNGFEGTKRGTDFWIAAEVSVKDPDGRRPEESAASGGRFRAALEPPQAIGRRAAERRAQRGARSGGPDVGPRSGAEPDDRDPQPLARTVQRLTDERGWAEGLSTGGVLSRWADVVGPEVAAHCAVEHLDGGVLTVRADSTAWATQVRLLAATLVRRLNEECGDGSVGRVVVLGPGRPTWRKGAWHVPGRGPRDTYG